MLTWIFHSNFLDNPVCHIDNTKQQPSDPIENQLKQLPLRVQFTVNDHECKSENHKEKGKIYSQSHTPKTNKARK